ncbi:hypothetical protein DL96DRAFT_1711124 [Flagelloscypha sp. PMI_526]|nr:hypothetical protein DL96DRAFT_1711124 [Flagelloscypha sp. PMI_526]
MSRPTRHEVFWYTDLKVENTFFKVPTSQLVKQSGLFKDMFDQGGLGLYGEGSSEENPIRVEGETKERFELLLTWIFHLSSTNNWKTPQWLAILPVAHKFQVASCIEKASKELQDATFDSCLRLRLALRYNLGLKFAQPAIEDLCKRWESPPAMGDADDQLPADICVEILIVRDKFMKGCLTKGCSMKSDEAEDACYSCGGYTNLSRPGYYGKGPTSARYCNDCRVGSYSRNSGSFYVPSPSTQPKNGKKWDSIVSANFSAKRDIPETLREKFRVKGRA